MSRRLSWNRRWVALVLALFLSGCALTSVYHGTSGLDPARNPAADLARAFTTAEESGRRVLIYVGGDWCRWCVIWKSFLEENSTIDELIKRAYVAVPVYLGPSQMNEEFLAQFPSFTTVPQWIFLESDGTYLHHQDLRESEIRGSWFDEVAVEEIFQRWVPAVHRSRVN